MTTETKKTNQQYIDEFITTLSDKNKTNTADLARLRRNAGNSLNELRDAEVFWSKLPYGMEYNFDWYLLVATLFPLVPPYDPLSDGEDEQEDKTEGESKKGKRWFNFGRSLRKMRDQLEHENQKESLNRHVGRLLDADDDQLPFLLLQLMQRLGKQKPRIFVDWRQLLSDLIAWNLSDRSIQRRWAQSYFVGKSANDETKQNIPSQEN